jgi:hypothetical protein
VKTSNIFIPPTNKIKFWIDNQNNYSQNNKII